ncbi:MAG: PQQ-binding-like beta-propeller repeat protein [Pseudomonadales bacterium]|nr:PQQ-binding-like beta-propeller repeat protein [Pseudomonadales bacterium]
MRKIGISYHFFSLFTGLLLTGQFALGQAGNEWATYGGNLASHRYSSLDQINADNFKDLEVAWSLRTDFLGPRPDGLYSATPLYVNDILYTTAGTRRAAVALDPASGEMIWMHSENEGERGTAGARQGAGRGVSYWENEDGTDRRIIYVTPGYRMIALDAETGHPVPSFGENGVVDLKQNFDQDIDPVDSNVGLNATPLVVGDVLVVGASHRPAGSMTSTWDTRGYVRGYDARTGERLWIFHTIPLPGEFGYDTWENGSADQNGNAGVWSQMSADPELGLVYLPVEMAAADYNGFNRPGAGLFGESIVAVDVRTGERRWHYQTIHHGLWDWDLPSAPILFDMEMDGEVIKALAQPTKSAFLFVLNRETGDPIWPIEERPVPQSDSPYEQTSQTQPFPTKPAPFDRQGISRDDLNDLTPALRAEAEAVIEQYQLGPLFTPPALEREGGPIGTLMLPADVGGANWPGGSFDPETNRLYIHSHTAVFTLRNIPDDLEPFNPGPDGEMANQPPGPPPGLGPRPGGLGAPGGLGPRRRSTFLQGSIPLIKPPYDRITAYDMNSGEILWQKTHGTTEDNIRNNPALAGVKDIDRLGSYGRIFIGTLTTGSLVIAGEGATHTNEDGDTVALLRAYDKATGEDIEGRVELPARQTGSPMTYMHEGKQYIVLAVSHAGADAGGELIAYTLKDSSINKE